MITGRRRHEFHELVEATAPGGAHSATYAPLLEVVGALRAVPAPVADPAFVARLREQLLAEAAVVLAPGAGSAVEERLRLRPVTPRSRRRNRRFAAAVSGLALAGTAATLSWAAQSALPGEHLYPLKRTIESAHAELTLDQAAQGRVLLGNASTRLDEVNRLSHEHADPALIASTLDSFTSEAISGSDLLVDDFQSSGNQSSITTVRTFTATSMTRLHDLQGSVPSGSADQLLRAAQALDQIQQVSVHTCAGCAGPLVTQVPTVLADALHATFAQAGPTPTGQQTTGHGGRQNQLSGPVLPHLGGNLPPASVTDPTTTDPADTTGTTGTASAHDVRTTLQNLTGNLTGGPQDSTGTDLDTATTNLLDAVSQTTGTVGNTVGTVVSQVTGLVPTGVPTGLPTGLPTGVPTGVPTSLPSLP